MSSKEKLLEIKKLAKEVAGEVKKIESQNKGNGKKKPVDIDMVKTQKAMFFEKVVEILKKGETQ